MPKFDYAAKDGQGQLVRGVIEAASEEIARGTLKDRGLEPEELIARAAAGLLQRDLPFFTSIPIKDLVIFSRQFSVLMGAKVPVVQSLRTVARQTQNRRFQAIIVDVADEAESGTPLSLAMAKHTKAFSGFFVNMVRSGETTGKLEDILNYLADQMERDYDLMNKIKGAMIYPIFIMVGLIAVGFVMMVYVIPKLTDVLKESGATLPWTTRLLIGTSGFFQKYALLIVVAVVGAAIGFRYALSTTTGRAIWDRAKLHVPVFGTLLQRIAIIRFTRSFGTLLSGGVDIPNSLDICADVVGNAHYRRMILETKKEVTDGNSVTTVFNRERTMPTMVSQMMAVGEETGRLQDVLAKLTEFYSREVQNLVSNLVAAIEPLIMLVMGLAVGIMVAAIILPMYNLATQF